MQVGENLLLKQLNTSRTYEWSGDQQRVCFLFLKDGKCKYLSDRVSQVLGAGDLIVFAKASDKLGALDAQGFSALRFLLSFAQLGALLGLRELSLLDKVSNNLSNSRYYPAASPMARQCHALVADTPPVLNLEHRSHLLKVAATILAEEFKAAEAPHADWGENNGDFARVLDRLALTDLETLPVDELAKKLGYSRRHLNRLFQEHLGTSVSALRMEVRLSKSLSLLKNPAHKVIDVAGTCGFNHLGLFSLCFKRRFGVSPSEWRRRELAREQGAEVVEEHQPAGLNAFGIRLWQNLQPKATSSSGVAQALQLNGHGKRLPAPAKTNGHRLELVTTRD